MSIKLKEVKTRKDLKKFVKFPFTLYKNNQYWAPPLIKDELKNFDSKKNPAFEHCRVKYWLAYKDGKIAGRIAGIINTKIIEKWKVKKARFGWIDFIDDFEVSRALVNVVEQWAEEQGMESLRDPWVLPILMKKGCLLRDLKSREPIP